MVYLRPPIECLYTSGLYSLIIKRERADPRMCRSPAMWLQFDTILTECPETYLRDIAIDIVGITSVYTLQVLIQVSSIYLGSPLTRRDSHFKLQESTEKEKIKTREEDPGIIHVRNHAKVKEEE
jgi:hypothetical protein